MRIGTKLKVAVVAATASALLAGVSLLVVSSRVQKAIQRYELIDEVSQAVFQLNSLTSEYLLTPEERVTSQWRARHRTLGDCLARIDHRTEGQGGIVDELRRNHKALERFFDRLVQNRSSMRGAGVREPVAVEWEQRLTGQLLAREDAMISEAARLKKAQHSAALRIQRAETIAVFAAAAIVAGIVGVGTWLARSSVIRPMQALQQGMAVVGRGELNFRVGTAADDEIGELGRAFDRMSASLQSITASRDELNREVAERKRAEIELEQRAKELAAVNQEIESFSYSVSHDLRAPLRSIDGFSKALLEDCSDRLDEQGKHYLGRVRAASQRMGQLIDDVLKLSRLSISEMVFEPVDLSALVRSAVAELRALDPGRVVTAAIAQRTSVLGDARLLKMAVENLVRNAWKFTGRNPEGRIEFGSFQRDGEDVFFLRDNGVGFDMRYADKMFGAFQRLHSADEFPGTGIGLATVQRIINRHGGRVWAEGEPDRGATFYFVLRRRLAAPTKG